MGGWGYPFGGFAVWGRTGRLEGTAGGYLGDIVIEVAVCETDRLPAYLRDCAHLQGKAIVAPGHGRTAGRGVRAAEWLTGGFLTRIAMRDDDSPVHWHSRVASANPQALV